MEDKIERLLAYYTQIFGIVCVNYSIEAKETKLHFFKKHDFIFKWSELAVDQLTKYSGTIYFHRLTNQEIYLAFIPVQKKGGTELIVLATQADADEYFMEKGLVQKKFQELAEMFFYSLYNYVPKRKQCLQASMVNFIQLQPKYEKNNQLKLNAPIAIDEKNVRRLEIDLVNAFQFLNFERGNQAAQKYATLIKDASAEQTTNQAIFLLTFLTKLAIENGCPIKIAYSIRDLYLKEIKQAPTVAVRKPELFAEKLYKRFFEKALYFRNSKKNKHISAVIEYNENHLYQVITLNELSKELQLTPNYLSGLFTKVMGMTVKAYILQRKIEEAKYLILYSDYSLAEISDLLAFSNQSHFCSQFKKLEGFPPSQFSSRNS